jgi:hypothetical protein
VLRKAGSSILNKGAMLRRKIITIASKEVTSLHSVVIVHRHRTTISIITEAVFITVAGAVIIARAVATVLAVAVIAEEAEDNNHFLNRETESEQVPFFYRYEDKIAGSFNSLGTVV